MKRILASFFVLTSGGLASAQGLSIEEALSKAKYSALQQADLDKVAQTINLKIQKAKRLPLVYGEGNVQRNLISPVTPVPAIAFDPSAAPGTIMPLRFVTDWSAKAGLQLSVDVFNPQNKANITNAEWQVKKARVAQLEAAESFKKDIVDLYAQAYLAQQQRSVAQHTEQRYESTYLVAEERFDAGRIGPVEWNNTQKKLLDLQQTSDEASWVYKNKLLALAPYLDVSQIDSFTTPIAQLPAASALDLEMERLTIEQQMKEQQISLLRYEGLPKLSINGYLGSQFYDNSLRIFDGNHWFGNSFVNLALRLPISEAYERSLRKKQYTAEYQIATSKLDERAAMTSKDALVRSNNIRLLTQKVGARERALALLADNVRIAQAQYDAGKILISEVNQAMEAQQQAQKELWQAEYDLLRTKINP